MSAGAPPAVPGTAGEGTASDPWFDAVDRYRDVAKWLVISFGAIGAVIAGTAPLTGIGEVAPDRLRYVVAGAAIALTGTALVFAATVTVLIPRAVYRYELKAAKQGPLRRSLFGFGRFENLLADHPVDLLPAGITSIEQLNDAIANLRRGGTALAATACSLPLSDPARAAHRRAADALLAAGHSHERVIADLLRIARYEKARTRFNQAVVAVLVGGLAAATGLALTLYGIGRKAASAPTPSPVLSDPARVIASLTPAGKESLKGRLGSTCDPNEIPTLLIAGDRRTGPWEIITLPERGCTSIRVTLTAELGTLG